MNMVKTALGVFLCILGALLVLFEVGMAKSQPHAFAWLPFLSLVALGVVILAGGILLLKGYGEGTSINMGKAVMGIVLCLVGVVFVLFASAEAISEWHSFLRDGWVPFLVFAAFGVLIFWGGVLLWRERRCPKPFMERQREDDTGQNDL